MKILYLVHQFYPEYYTGTEKFVLNLAKMMQKCGHKTKIITYSFYNDSFYDKEMGNILLKEFTYSGVSVIALKHKTIPSSIHYTLEDHDLHQIAETLLLQENPDVIHVGHPMRITELIKTAINLQIPYFITLTDFFSFCPKYNLLTSTNQLCLGSEQGNSCRISCPEISNYLADRHHTAYGILSAAKKLFSPSSFLAGKFKNEFRNLDIDLIPHGINYNYVKRNQKIFQKEHPLIFGYSGTFINHKGPQIVIEAFLKTKSDNAKLKLYGSGPDPWFVNELRKLASPDNRIEFCGVYTENDIGHILGNIDVVVVPSLWYENYPLVLHEALACRVPVIASNAGGMAEKIKDGMNGFTFEMGNTDQLSIVLEKVMHNPEMLNDVKRNMKKNFIPTLEQEAYRYEQEYRRILLNR